MEYNVFCKSITISDNTTQARSNAHFVGKILTTSVRNVVERPDDMVGLPPRVPYEAHVIELV